MARVSSFLTSVRDFAVATPRVSSSSFNSVTALHILIRGNIAERLGMLGHVSREVRREDLRHLVMHRPMRPRAFKRDVFYRADLIAGTA